MGQYTVTENCDRHNLSIKSYSVSTTSEPKVTILDAYTSNEHKMERYLSDSFMTKIT